MEEILHQLIGSLFRFFPRFYTSQEVSRISFINSMFIILYRYRIINTDMFSSSKKIVETQTPSKTTMFSFKNTKGLSWTIFQCTGWFWRKCVHVMWDVSCNIYIYVYINQYILTYTSSHNHGSQKWIPPIVVTFQILPFSTSIYTVYVTATYDRFCQPRWPSSRPKIPNNFKDILGAKELPLRGLPIRPTSRKMNGWNLKLSHLQRTNSLWKIFMSLCSSLSFSRRCLLHRCQPISSCL